MDLIPTVFACDQCKFYTKVWIELNLHKNLNHSFVAKENKLKCSKCNFESGHSYQLRKHEEKCNTVNPILECEGELCRFKISSLFHLIRHERTEHGITTRTLPQKKLKNKSSKCQKCGQVCRKDYMKKHMEKCSKSGMKYDRH